VATRSRPVTGASLSPRAATAELFKLINMETLISPGVLIPASIRVAFPPLPSARTGSEGASGDGETGGHGRAGFKMLLYRNVLVFTARVRDAFRDSARDAIIADWKSRGIRFSLSLSSFPFPPNPPSPRTYPVRNCVNRHARCVMHPQTKTIRAT